jgi:hypothetical protein
VKYALALLDDVMGLSKQVLVADWAWVVLLVFELLSLSHRFFVNSRLHNLLH